MSTIDAIRAAVGIDAVLGAYGHASLTKGRMACPIHHGDNPQCFAVKDNERFTCFNCGAHGDAVDLERLLGGGALTEALQRLCQRYDIAPAKIDVTADRRRRRRAARLKLWWAERCRQWGVALHIADTAVGHWQTDPSSADDDWWGELDARCTARDRAEAMHATFTGLHTIEQRASAYKIEQRGDVVLPWEAAD